MITATHGRRHTTAQTFTFPGPWLGGTSLIVGPILLLTGTLVRLGVPFFFPHQLAAYQRQPALIGAAYAIFLAGVIALWPGVVAVATRIGETRPGWALWGGSLVMFGLFARTFHYGVNTFAFSLVNSAGLDNATRAVEAYYGYREWVVTSLSLSLVSGWVVLAVGCFLSRTLRLLPAIALALMSGLMVGVLKGSTWASVVEVTGLVVAFVPLGVSLLRAADRPSSRTLRRVSPLLLLFIAGSIVLGQLG
ncbi:hypothetical protein GA0070606_5357 [Micromonospora citrea]|uniref:Uncharacterized protein n=1 Tax=Micromonospora citrea TaxID=47855 RepID=A0A1C6VVQ4_9ACTN|nr:hypothetical protein [Micromonospora citrea]SCL70312.1 hypothetical protein GA0070606_5357 [Micromonospora citrea]